MSTASFSQKDLKRRVVSHRCSECESGREVVESAGSGLEDEDGEGSPKFIPPGQLENREMCEVRKVTK